MAVVFGVLAIIFGIFAPWLLGWVGFGFIAVLGVLAIVFTITRNNKLPEGTPKKKAGIVCGVIGILIALLMQMSLGGLAKKMQSDMEKYKDQFPAIAMSVDKLEPMGLIGMANALGDSGYSAEDLQKQFEEYSKILSESTAQ